MTSPTKGVGYLSKGEVTPKAYLVKWVTSFMDGPFSELKFLNIFHTVHSS